MTIKKIIPIGAIWKADGPYGERATIYLAERSGRYEVWRWTLSHGDGSGFKQDWAPSYRLCYMEVGYKIRDRKTGKVPRFKRVKGT